MPTLSRDTGPAAEATLIELSRAMSPARKIALTGQMNTMVRALALSGLRQRHPGATAAELRRRLAEHLLGAELAAKTTHHHELESPMLSEPFAVTMQVIDILEALGVRYFIGGSLASIVHGLHRSTLDADLLADLRPEHAAPLVKALGDEFYADLEAILDAINRRDSFNLIHQPTLFKIDIFIPKRRAFDQQQFERRVQHTLATNPARTAYIASAEDIVLAKLEWHKLGGGVSKRQWEDVLGVLKTQGDRLDFAYLHWWAAALEITDLLEQALREAK